MSDTELIHGVPAAYWHESKVHILIGGSVALIILTIITIVLRFYARMSSRAPLWWDDWFALATVPLCLLNPVYDLVQIHYGFGRHQVVMLKTDVPRAEKFGLNLYIILLFYNIDLAIFKYSFLALYIRIFSVAKWLRYTCYVLGVMITMWCIACVFAIGFRCRPVAANWNPAAGECIPMRPIFLAQSVPTITFDILILVLPVRLVLNLQLARPAKIGVIVVFLLGGLVTIISIVRLYVLLNTTEDDIPWDYVSIGLWSAGEPITGLVCCSLPAYAPLLRRILARTNIGWTTASKGSGGKSGAISNNDHPTRSTRSYWGGGYKRSEKDSDTFELTETVNGDIVRDAHPGGRLDPESQRPGSWSHEGIRVTQEIDVQSEAGQVRSPPVSRRGI